MVFGSIAGIDAKTQIDRLSVPVTMVYESTLILPPFFFFFTRKYCPHLCLLAGPLGRLEWKWNGKLSEKDHI